MIYERATLFGLPVVARRPVPLAPIDPGQARRILIDAGLVEQQLVSRSASYQHNVRLLDEVQAWAAKTRRRDLVVDAFFLQQFYEARLPATVVDRASLEKADREPNNMKLTWDELVASFDRNDAKQSFPEQLAIGLTELPLEYRFTPGTDDDGVTIRVPESAVGNLSEDRLGWLVPGLLEEKVTSLIKTLPKQIRRNLVPAPAIAAKAMQRLAEFRAKQAPFWPSLCNVLGQLAGERIQASDFELDRLDPHLKIRLEIVDQAGKVVQATRELGPQSPVRANGSTASSAIAPEARQDWYRDQMTTFDIDVVPRSIIVSQQGLRLERHVGLVDYGTFVRPELFDDPKQADVAMFGGLLRLFALADHRELRSQISYLPQYKDCQLWLADRLGSDRLRKELEDLIAKLAFLDGDSSSFSAGGIWGRSEFENRRVDRVQRISLAAAEVGKWLPKFGQSYHTLRLAMQSLAPAWKTSIDDVRQQLDHFFRPKFMVYTAWPWLKEFPRYLTAIQHRLGRLKTAGVAQDAQLLDKVRIYESDLQKRLDSQTYSVFRIKNADAKEATNETLWPMGKLAEYRWMIEEYRVSLFAQQLGTRVSISPKRLDKLREECD